MSLMEWINYSLIVVFFVVAAGLIIVISGPRRRDEAASEKQKLPPLRQNKLAYALVCGLFLLLVCVALLSGKKSGTE